MREIRCWKCGAWLVQIIYKNQKYPVLWIACTACEGHDKNREVRK